MERFPGDHIDDTAHKVALAGSFNNWSNAATMFFRNGGGVWKAEIPMLPAGKYAYKFVVNGSSWVSDPANALTEPDGLDGINNILIVPA